MFRSRLHCTCKSVRIHSHQIYVNIWKAHSILELWRWGRWDQFWYLHHSSTSSSSVRRGGGEREGSLKGQQCEIWQLYKVNSARERFGWLGPWSKGRTKAVWYGNFMPGISLRSSSFIRNLLEKPVPEFWEMVCMLKRYRSCWKVTFSAHCCHFGFPCALVLWNGRFRRQACYHSLPTWPPSRTHTSHKAISPLKKGLEKGLKRCSAAAQSTCRICPAYKHFPPTPCFVHRVHT